MFRQPTRNTSDGETRQPLLGGSQENLAEERVVFEADSDSDGEHGALGSPKDTGRSVRFEDDIQVIAPPLRSAVHSRETGVPIFLLR
jgi:sodium-coupled neutral amino acid transporter 11